MGNLHITMRLLPHVLVYQMGPNSKEHDPTGTFLEEDDDDHLVGTIHRILRPHRHPGDSDDTYSLDE
jgi:hypothetical protein